MRHKPATGIWHPASFAAAFAFIAASLACAADLPKAAAILEAHCLRCHNASVRMSGLSLVSEAGAAKGGLQGPAIVPGKPDESNLLRTALKPKADVTIGDNPSKRGAGPRSVQSK